METPRTTVTNQDVLKRAFWMVKVPSMTLMLGPWLISYLLMKRGVIPQYGLEGMRWFVPLFLAGFVLGWLAWSVQVPRWKLWAYERVDDIPGLKEEAVSTQVIWPDGSLFTRTEIMSSTTREAIRALEEEGARHGA